MQKGARRTWKRNIFTLGLANSIPPLINYSLLNSFSRNILHFARGIGARIPPNTPLYKTATKRWYSVAAGIAMVLHYCVNRCNPMQAIICASFYRNVLLCNKLVVILHRTNGVDGDRCQLFYCQPVGDSHNRQKTSSYVMCEWLYRGERFCVLQLNILRPGKNAWIGLIRSRLVIPVSTFMAANHPWALDETIGPMVFFQTFTHTCISTNLRIYYPLVDYILTCIRMSFVSSASPLCLSTMADSGNSHL